jgi:hypothetical protein
MLKGFWTIGVALIAIVQAMPAASLPRTGQCDSYQASLEVTKKKHSDVRITRYEGADAQRLITAFKHLAPDATFKADAVVYVNLPQENVAALVIVDGDCIKVGSPGTAAAIERFIQTALDQHST